MITPMQLEKDMSLQVQTMDSKYKPSDAMKMALESLSNEIQDIKNNFEVSQEASYRLKSIHKARISSVVSYS